MYRYFVYYKLADNGMGNSIILTDKKMHEGNMIDDVAAALKKDAGMKEEDILIIANFILLEELES